MSLVRLLGLVGLSLCLINCSTGKLADIPGRPKTTLDLGVRYLLGRGVPQDNEKAFSYFKKAAEDNDPFAQNELAYLYATGNGTEKNLSQALYWYETAARQGLSSAQYNAGLFYEMGWGVAKNNELAQKWYEQSAALGFEPAKIALTHFNVTTGQP